MSNGLITIKGAGSTPVRATYLGKTAAINVSTSSVTGVTPVFNSYPATGGALLFVGTDYTFSAKDQSGSALDGTVGAWSSSDPTNAPIDASTGVCSPAAGVTGCTLTYTHTESGLAANVPILVLKAPAVVFDGDAADNYADSAALYANVWGDDGNTSGTGDSSVKYNVATAPALTQITIEDIATYPMRNWMGKKSFLQNFPGGGVSGGGIGLAYRASKRVWILRLERVAPPGEAGPLGDATQFTLASNWAGGGNLAEKAGPGVSFSGANGRVQAGYNGAPPLPGATCNYDWYAVDNEGLGVGAAAYAEPAIGGGEADFHLGGKWLMKLWLTEERTKGIISSRLFHAPFGSAPTWLGSVQAEFATRNADTLTFDWVNAFSWNWNEPRDDDQLFYRSIGDYQIVDGAAAGNGDPYGVLGAQPSPTLTSVDVATIAHGATGSVITLTGTGYNANCYPVFSNAGIHVTPCNGNNGNKGKVDNLALTGTTQFVVKIDCNSGATTGAGTVKIYNAASQGSSATVAFSVT